MLATASLPARRGVSLRQTGRQPEPHVARRRRIVTALVASGALSLVGLGAHGVLTGPGGGPASAAGTVTARQPAYVVAHPGDSLWSIAERHRGEIGVRSYVDALVALNGGTAIQAGQAVRLP